MQCFRNYNPDGVKDIELQELTRLQTKNQSLTQSMAHMEEHSRIIASEFARAERKNVQLTQQLA